MWDYLLSIGMQKESQQLTDFVLFKFPTFLFLKSKIKIKSNPCK